MPRMNSSLRRRAAELCDEQQLAQCAAAKQTYPGRQCQVELRKVLNDPIDENWAKIDCRGALVIDHVDNNNDNNPANGSNFQWLCRAHNVAKNPPGHHRAVNKFADIKHLEQSLERERVRERERANRYAIPDEGTIIRYEELRINKQAEPKARRLTRRLIEKNGVVNTKDLIDSVSEQCGISQQTYRRYLDKMISRWGGFLQYADKEKTIIMPRVDDVADDPDPMSVR